MKRINILLFILIPVFSIFLADCGSSKKHEKFTLKKTYKKIKKELPKGFFIWPVKGKVSSGFGKRRGRNHDGIDIKATKGTKIRAAAKGNVIFSGWGPKGYGKIIIVKHAYDLVTVYAHNLKNYVSKGQRVKKGKTIGLVGKTGRATGYHLHFEIRAETTPINPLKYLPPAKR